MLLLTASTQAARLIGRLGTPTRLSVARTGIGVVMVTRPALVPTTLGVDTATADRMAWAVQMLGAREIALGLGTLAASRSGDRRATRMWLMAGLLSDAVDAAAVARAVGAGRLSRTFGSAVVATSAVAAGLEARALVRRASGSDRAIQ